jgi:hypothetical protein
MRTAVTSHVGRRRRRLAGVVAAAWLFGILGLTVERPSADQQQPATPPPAGQPQNQDQPVVQLPEQPIFRGGINFVRVDVIVTDGKDNPVTDLKETDFEVLEDNQPQSIDQFRLIKVEGTYIPKPGDPPPRELRNRDDEVAEAAKDDVRVFAFLLDDYHVRRANSISIRDR